MEMTYYIVAPALIVLNNLILLNNLNINLSEC